MGGNESVQVQVQILNVIVCLNLFSGWFWPLPKVITIPTSWASGWITIEWGELWRSIEADSHGLKCENKYLLLYDIVMVRLFYMQTKWTDAGTWWLWEWIRMLSVYLPYTWSLDTFPVTSQTPAILGLIVASFLWRLTISL